MTAAGDIFKTSSETISDLLIANGEFFYIPAYQRQYNWTKAQVQRLIETSVEGLLGLLEDGDSFSFLGTIILIKDDKHKTIAPIHKNEVPAKVKLVIDGQQRLTTIILLLVALHDVLRTHYDSITAIPLDKKTQTHLDLETLLADSLNLIKDMLVEGKFRAEKPNDPAPYIRMIRAFDDAWSKKDNERKYGSPIASLVHSYGFDANGFTLGVKKPVFHPTAPSPGHAGSNLLQTVCRDRFIDIRKILKELKTDKGIGDENLQLPSVSQILHSKEILSAVHISLTDAVRQDLLNPDLDTKLSIALKDLVFTRFLLYRVAVTVVYVQKEQYAFSVFDALNTTGQPLAPLETFKPLVMQSVELEKYAGSEEENILDSIFSFVGDLDKDSNRTFAKDATVSFALVENGHKLSKESPEQRNYFRATYRRVEGIPGARRDYLQHLESTVALKRIIFEDSLKSRLPRIDKGELSEETIMCLAFLADLKHTIVLPLLVRMYMQIPEDRTDSARIKAINDFDRTVRAIAAFTVLYRSVSTSVTTDGVDDVYRQVMSGLNSPTSLAALHRSDMEYRGTNASILSPLDVDLLIADLAARLTHTSTGPGVRHRGIANKNSFVSKAAQVPIYKNTHIARFLLIAAFHDNAHDAANPGLLMTGIQGANPTMSLKTWNSKVTETVEHIAPQTAPSSGWDAGIYAPDNSGLVSRLGNLTLCPQSVNSSLGNETWARKRMAYKALGQPGLAAAKAALSAATPPFDSLLKKLTQEDLSYNVFFKDIGEKNDDWDVAFIKKRTENLLGFAWDRIAPWLGL